MLVPHTAVKTLDRMEITVEAQTGPRRGLRHGSGRGLTKPSEGREEGKPRLEPRPRRGLGHGSSRGLTKPTEDLSKA